MVCGCSPHMLHSQWWFLAPHPLTMYGERETLHRFFAKVAMLKKKASCLISHDLVLAIYPCLSWSSSLWDLLTFSLYNRNHHRCPLGSGQPASTMNKIWACARNELVVLKRCKRYKVLGFCHFTEHLVGTTLSKKVIFIPKVKGTNLSIYLFSSINHSSQHILKSVFYIISTSNLHSPKVVQIKTSPTESC
jgi:hypothetical protein